jgi:hypothetical protein
MKSNPDSIGTGQVATKNTARVLVKRRKPEKLPHGKEYFFKPDEKTGKPGQEFGGKQ